MSSGALKERLVAVAVNSYACPFTISFLIIFRLVPASVIVVPVPTSPSRTVVTVGITGGTITSKSLDTFTVWVVYVTLN